MKRNSSIAVPLSYVHLLCFQYAILNIFFFKYPKHHMIKQCPIRLGRNKGPRNLKFGVDTWRIVQRRRTLEDRRIAEAQTYIPPVEPTRKESLRLYRNLLKEAQKTLKFTPNSYFKQQVRHEYTVIAPKTSSRVRGIMFEKGKWMVDNKLGGLM